MDVRALFVKLNCRLSKDQAKWYKKFTNKSFESVVRIEISAFCVLLERNQNSRTKSETKDGGI